MMILNKNKCFNVQNNKHFYYHIFMIIQRQFLAPWGDFELILNIVIKTIIILVLMRLMSCKKKN